MSRASKYAPELRERAVRMVFDHAHEHPSQWATIRSVAEKIGCTVEALRRWVRQAEGDGGQRPGLTTDERARLKQLERENFELKRANEILKTASACFAQAVLPIAPSTYFRHKAGQLDPTRRSMRAQRDAVLRAIIRRIYQENRSVYGPRKVWKQMGREGRQSERETRRR